MRLQILWAASEADKIYAFDHIYMLSCALEMLNIIIII